jgi:hypothetical protein
VYGFRDVVACEQAGTARPRRFVCKPGETLKREASQAG